MRLHAGNIWAHLLPLLVGIVAVAAGTASAWPFEGYLLLSLFLPVLLCLTGSVIYHTFMANHWNYKAYITLDVGPMSGFLDSIFFVHMHTFVLHVACNM